MQLGAHPAVDGVVFLRPVVDERDHMPALLLEKRFVVHVLSPRCPRVERVALQWQPPERICMPLLASVYRGQSASAARQRRSEALHSEASFANSRSHTQHERNMVAALPGLPAGCHP